MRFMKAPSRVCHKRIEFGSQLLLHDPAKHWCGYAYDTILALQSIML
jgi:hypothetical protein